MHRFVSVFCALILVTTFSFGQDSVFMMDGSEVVCKVLRVSDKNIHVETNGVSENIDPAEVLLIVYQDGEVLKMSKSNSNQNSTSPINAGLPIGKLKRDSMAVLTADGILFCGFNFSLIRLVNPEKLGTDEAVSRYVGIWNAYLREKLNVKKQINNTWEASRHIDLFNPNHKPTQLVFSSSTKDYPIDTYLKLIAQYEIDAKDKLYYDVALSVFPVEFNKRDEEVHCRFVFFDPKSLDIIWAPIATGKAGCCGMAGHWADGVFDSIKNLTGFVQAVKGISY